MKKHSIKEATEEWINGFNYIPGPVIEKLAEADETVSYFDSDSFRLIASPRIECLGCNTTYEGDLLLDELREAYDNGTGVPCEYCEYNKGDDWTMGRPEYAFPCGWGTLFAPKDFCDINWILQNADEVAELGFFVFESEDYSVMLGIDAGGFDFYEAFWIPLYKHRGLKWHDVD